VKIFTDQKKIVFL